MNYQLTGNPFVDTGIFAMQAHASKLHGNKEINALTPELVTEVLGDGTWLAKTNRQLNSFFMVFMNSPLSNPSSNPYALKKGAGRRGLLSDKDKGWQIYVSTLLKLRDELKKPQTGMVKVCESCGERPASDVLENVGRDFFPLAGSSGNDAQALPSASRTPRLCALCLLAVHWTPLGTVMFNEGRRSFLACFQFTESKLTQQYVENVFRRNCKLLGMVSISDSVQVPGSSEGKTPAAKILIEEMRQLYQAIEKDELPQDVTLNIWKFNNYADKADSEVVEIHNPALQFLWQAASKYPVDIFDLLNREDSKKTATHLLSTIERKVDYGGFYPGKGGKSGAKVQLASMQLYELYQTRILARSHVALEAAKRLATLVHARLSSADKKEQKLLAQILKENPRWTKDRDTRVALRRLIATFAEEGRFTLELYAHLFPAANLEQLRDATPESARVLWSEPGAAVRPTNQGWDLVWFYLHHAAKGTLDVSTQDAIQTTDADEDLSMFTNPKIQEFARDVFSYFLEKRGGSDTARGLTFIKKHLLDGFAHRTITNEVLRRWFCKLAETREGYKCEEWDALCKDEQGRDATIEVRFQMRLELANLYREAMKQQSETAARS